MEKSPPILRTEPRWLRITSWFAFGLATTALVLAGVVMLGIVPVFDRGFAEIDLPLLTAWLFRMPSWLVVVVIVGWCSGLVFKERSSWPRWLTLLLNGITLGAITFVFVGVFVALFLPLIKIIEDMSLK